MPDDEGGLTPRRRRSSCARSRGTLLEVGTYCGKSAVYLGAAARATATILSLSISSRQRGEPSGSEHHDDDVVDRVPGV